MTVTGRARPMRPAKRATVPNTIPSGESGYMSPYFSVGFRSLVLVREFSHNDSDRKGHED